MTHLLDSSAWLAHLFGEPGVDEVTDLLANPDKRVTISVLSIPEVFGRLKAMYRADRWPDVWEAYTDLFSAVIPADETIAHQAIHLRQSTTDRLPTIDGLIAASALVHDYVLVHRDPHMAAIAEPELKQLQLPDR